MPEIYGGRRLTPSELLELSRPFPEKYVRDDGRGNAYVPHHIITQRLIQIFGTPPKIEVLRELYDETKLTGVVMRLTIPGLEPIEEAGEADNPQSKTNGARAKDACSDAIKRCAMRLGLGLHLWAQKDYFLHDVLVRDSGNGSESREKGDTEEVPVSTAEVAGEPGSVGGSTTESAATKDSTGGGTEEVGGDGGGSDHPRASDDASSGGDSLKTILEARVAKRVTQADILRVATVEAGKKGIGNVTTKTLGTLPEDVLEAIVHKLQLNQEALV